MKPFYLTLVLLAAQPACAQLVNHVVGQVNTVTRQLDMTTQHIRQQTERDLERLKPGADKLLANTTQTLRILAKLPEQLPIVNSAGKTLFIEVEVENGWRALQREWLITLDEDELTSLQKLPVEILEKNHFAELGITLVRFRVPPELDSLAALKQQLPEAMGRRLDRNHIYSSQAGNNSASTDVQVLSACGLPVKIGMIDTAIQLTHPAFSQAIEAGRIHTQHFLEQELKEPDAHGTAVAGLLMGTDKSLTPLLPRATLYAASVFYSRNQSAQGASMMNLVRALNWLMTEKVSVINMSLAGPDNQILARVIAKTISNGTAIVAAVGNEGPAAPALYPAAYPEVIGVTAVDRKQKIYRWANRGNQVSFAAPGVSVITASSAGGVSRESGTSMAAPVVTALISCELQKTPDINHAINTLADRALDLGEPGRDVVFGFGLLK